MTNRKAVKKFFEYELDNEPLKKGSVNIKSTLIFTLIAVGVGFFLFRNPVLALLLAIATPLIVGLISYIRAKSRYKKRLKERDKNHQEFETLVKQVRSIIGDDLIKAFLRIFERTQIDRQELRTLERSYSASKERDFLSEETLEEKLGDLMNKSIRLYSQGEFTNQYVRFVPLTETDQYEVFFNPLRLVVLFLTETQLVICDVQIDSVDGDLREEIQKISLQKIVNVHFTAERTRINWSTEDIVQTARDLGYDEDEINQIREDVEKSDDAENERDWVLEEMTSRLFVTRTDSGALDFPIRTQFYFGKHVSALDQANVLTEDEITVDRMVNELNRLVEHAK